MMWPYPAFHTNFFSTDTSSGIHHHIMLIPAGAEFAFAMRWDFHFDHRCPKVCDVAKKLDRAFFMAIFHFSVRRTHSAERLNSALSAFGQARAPTCPHTVK